MPDLTTSSAIDTFMQSADAAAMRTAMGALSTGSNASRPYFTITAETTNWAATPGVEYKVAAFTSSLEITSFGSPVEGSTIVVHLLGANGTAVLTFPSAKRFGQSDAAQTTLTPTAGNHIITFKYIGTTWYFADTVATTALASEGGTGLTTTTAYSPLFSGTTATGTFKADTGPGTSGYVLTSNGAGAYPTWQAASSILATGGSGTAVIDNSNAETAIAAVTIPGNTLYSGGDKGVRLFIAGKMKNNSGAARGLTLRVAYGATTVFQDSTSATLFTASTGERTYVIDLILSGNGSANAQYLTGIWGPISSATAPTTGLGDIGSALSFPVSFSGTAAEASAGDLSLTVYITLDTANTEYEWYVTKYFATRL